MRFAVFTLCVALFAADLGDELHKAARAGEFEQARALLDRGASHLALGNLKEAVADCSRVIELSPRLADAFYLRGKAYRQLGDDVQAEADRAQALKLDPTVVDLDRF